ncbi:Hsp33 family molecular chaperone HslO [Clostridium estertheticum]|uniref:33 kDa chaperonin n=2 Tax=Clostridium estertheticum TaxID=238834 RepID=A0A1J0GLA8_9CLOT|nr:Hsp33 family molecular chaperone HslO [Clostridium estertheticum]APC41736.1 Hsp33 family molecular chaperone [Clostridium estertheticum subsp. estertheticum]MBU3073429.1 Hsp33 family molecular chaperone HslO [Clostridium estertheticum]MBU3163330.1 Hsp33 family molecular chaperone HslO [Clostridium estertheticum]MBU3171591.1 Hsp33 family molecular chaperone HslO [Clostridium estertheticum]MBW9170525.1 Hsp33 family molecular chaperone HslO [Clostridium estertheticum]
MDNLVRATAKEGQVRIVAAITTELVNEGVTMHQCAPTAAAAFGRMLTAGTLMGTLLKSEKDSLTLQIDGGGQAKGVVVTAHADSSVKGYIGNPNVDLPANTLGKLDVGGAVGKDGYLRVIRDMGLKEPYIGQVPIRTGEIGDDLAYYFTVSEQTPSAVGLGVLVDTDMSIKAAGGFIIQMMPDADEFLADMITYRLEEIPSITDFIAKGMSICEILEFIFEDMELKIHEEVKPMYKCDCSRERVERALISIGKKDLEEIYNDDKTEELKCHFCNKNYEFNHEDIGKLLKEAKS